MIPLLSALTPIIEKALSFIPDPAKKAEAQLKLTQEINEHSETILASLTAVDVAQAAVNLEEAKSTDPFVSRARPAIMWICAAGLAWECIVHPILGTILVIAKHPEMVAQLPPINSQVLITMLGYMLGYGGMRTWEKTKGVAATK
jgi:hypothetical protein